MNNGWLIAAGILAMVGCGIICSYLLMDPCPDHVNVASQKIAFCAKMAMKKGQIIKRGDLAELLCPSKEVPSNAMPGGETAYGCAVQRDIADGEILLRTDVRNYKEPKFIDVFIR